MIKRKIISRRAEGVEVARGSFSWDEEIEPLAAPWLENALRWLDEKLLPYAERTFESDPAPDKRFFFRRFEYVLSISVDTVSDGVAILSVEASLSRGGEILKALRQERLRLDGLTFLPPEKKKKAPRRVPPSASAE